MIRVLFQGEEIETKHVVAAVVVHNGKVYDTQRGYGDMNEVYDRQKEINEAIRAGERALVSLREAERQLNSAGNWGLVDLFGGDVISGLMKHKKINNASQCVENARRDLATFRDELGDIRDIENLHVDIDGFLTFADFFFDGFLADIFVQSKITV